MRALAAVDQRVDSAFINLGTKVKPVVEDDSATREKQRFSTPVRSESADGGPFGNERNGRTACSGAVGPFQGGHWGGSCTHGGGPPVAGRLSGAAFLPR